mmetsp:Transcript_178569/g.572373  ORF Transcript_178569/g.572373 Transcript_178569/m.572373 type:complete len:127 (+) Transcript_178569:405-785(+)
MSEKSIVAVSSCPTVCGRLCVLSATTGEEVADRAPLALLTREDGEGGQEADVLSNLLSGKSWSMSSAIIKKDPPAGSHVLKDGDEADRPNFVVVPVIDRPPAGLAALRRAGEGKSISPRWLRMYSS